MWHKTESKTYVALVLELTWLAMPLKSSGGKMAKEVGVKSPMMRSSLPVVQRSIALCSTAWVQKIKAASEQYIETEKKKREKAYQGTKFLSPSYPRQTPAQRLFWRMPQCLCGVSWIPRSIAFFWLQPIHLFLTCHSQLAHRRPQE